MKVLTAKFVNGRLEVPEGSLREGDTVTLLVPEHEGRGFSLAPEERALLARSIAQADRGEVMDGWKLLRELED
jgi:hypothetical protein